MADYVEKYSSKASDELEKRIKRVYKQAAKEVQKKLDDFISGHKARNAKMLQMVADGQLSEQDYQKWMRGQVFQGDQWKQKLKDVTEVYVHADEKAREIVGGTSKNVFMEAANYTAYDLEKGLRGAVAFNVYDAKTVERLLRKDPKMLPEWKIDQPKDYTWNEKRVRNAVTQGIIQGESIEEVGERLTSELSTSNAKKMDMFARTAVNGAQNAGRMDRLHEAEEMGIEVKKKWLATLDNRTRDTHQALDGQEQPIDEPFVVDGMKIDYPGDPLAPPELVYNCRCTLTYVYPKYQHLQHNHERRDQLNDKNIENMTYYEWVGLASKNKQEEEIEEEEPTVVHKVVQGKDITETWERRAGEFDFEIDDVVNAQGFDGLPQIVSKEEFKKIAEENKFIAQRGYIAPNKETLDAYRNQLYHGKWYVDCSHGNSMYGQGMYAGANFVGEMSDGVKHVGEDYSKNDLGYVETFTMRDPKFVNYDDINSAFHGGFSPDDVEKLYSGLTKDETIFLDMNASALFSTRSAPDWQEAAEAANRLGEEGRTKVIQKFANALKEAKEKSENYKDKYKDVGAFAAACGYDGIVCGSKEEDGVTVVILNRTKCIFLDPKSKK